MPGGTSSTGTKSPRGSTRRSRLRYRYSQTQGRPLGGALVISNPTDLLQGVLDLDMLTKEFSGRWRECEFVPDIFGYGKVAVNTGSLELNLQSFCRSVIADGSDVTRIDRLTLDFSHRN